MCAKMIIEYMLKVSMQVLILFMLIAVGYILTKAKMLGEKGAKQITNLVLYFVTPAVILNAFVGGKVENSPENIKKLGVAVVAAVIAHAIALLIGAIAFRGHDRESNLRICTVMSSNCGFMSLPLAQAILGAEGVFIVTIYVGIFNIITWTLGVRLISGKQISLKRAIFNPGVLSAAAGIILFLCGVNLSTLEIANVKIIMEPIQHLANLNTPLPMIVIGYYLANASLKLRKGDGQMLLTIALRLVVAPVITMFVLRLIGITGTSLSASVLPACAPVAVAVMMFAASFDSDAEGTSRTVSLSHLFSIFTMPVILVVCKLIGG